MRFTSVFLYVCRSTLLVSMPSAHFYCFPSFPHPHLLHPSYSLLYGSLLFICLNLTESMYVINSFILLIFKETIVSC